MIKKTVLVLGLFLLGCGNHDDSGSNGNQNGSGDGGPIVLSTYQMLDKDLFAPKCSRCHDGTHFSGVDTSSYQGIINSNIVVAGDPGRSLLATSITSGFMPRSGPRILTSDDIFLLLENWIQNGALETDI